MPYPRLAPSRLVLPILLAGGLAACQSGSPEAPPPVLPPSSGAPVDIYEAGDETVLVSIDPTGSDAIRTA